MNHFKAWETRLSYKDILQVDGAFSVVHKKYGKSPIFNRINSRELVKTSRPLQEEITDVTELIESFDGTKKDLKKDDRLSLWKNYWKDTFANLSSRFNPLKADTR